MQQVWKALGMDMSRVEFVWCSDEINSRAGEYWSLVMDIACKNKLGRVIRCSQIMGRNDTDDLAASQIFYPCMQCADIFFLKVRAPPLSGSGSEKLHVARARPMRTHAFSCSLGSTTRGISSRVTITSYISEGLPSRGVRFLLPLLSVCVNVGD